MGIRTAFECLFKYPYHEPFMEEAEKLWGEFVKKNQDLLLSDIEEDCAPARRYHFLVTSTSISSEVEVVFGEYKIALLDPDIW